MTNAYNLIQKMHSHITTGGIVKHKLEDFAGAIMDYDLALSLDPQMATAYFNRAMAKEILGRQGFERDYQVAAILNPKYDLNRYNVDAEALAQNKQGSSSNFNE